MYNHSPTRRCFCFIRLLTHPNATAKILKKNHICNSFLHISKISCTFVDDCKSMRDAHGSKQLSLKQFAYICERMVEIEEQLKKWKAYYQKDNINQ